MTMLNENNNTNNNNLWVVFALIPQTSRTIFFFHCNLPSNTPYHHTLTIVPTPTPTPTHQMSKFFNANTQCALVHETVSKDVKLLYAIALKWSIIWFEMAKTSSDFSVHNSVSKCWSINISMFCGTHHLVNICRLSEDASQSKWKLAYLTNQFKNRTKEVFITFHYFRIKIFCELWCQLIRNLANLTILPTKIWLNFI